MAVNGLGSPNEPGAFAHTDAPAASGHTDAPLAKAGIDKVALAAFDGPAVVHAAPVPASVNGNVAACNEIRKNCVLKSLDRCWLEDPHTNPECRKAVDMAERWIKSADGIDGVAAPSDVFDKVLDVLPKLSLSAAVYLMARLAQDGIQACPLEKWKIERMAEYVELAEIHLRGGDVDTITTSSAPDIALAKYFVETLSSPSKSPDHK